MNTTAVTSLAGRFDIAEPPTTDGTIALLNLQAEIDGQEAGAVDRRSVGAQVALVELISLRGLILGHVADYERAEALAEQSVRMAPSNAEVFVARARARTTFHRFADALNDLDVAQQLSADADLLNCERAAILQALGCYDEALDIRQAAAERRPSFETIGALAGLRAELGEVETAERLCLEARSRYRSVSPFPLAVLDFQLGRMCMDTGQLDDARTRFVAALRRVPAYAPAEGHLAEVEADSGEVEAAVARLHPLAASSDDPDYAAQLARILNEMGRTEESCHWFKLAGARYDELIARHPEAFADHAAEFWLAAGADPDKALRLARMNLDIRKTPRAYDLLACAISASEAAGAKDSAGARGDADYARPFGGCPC